MSRCAGVTLLVLAGLALTAILLAWPRDRWELVGGAVLFGTNRTSKETQYRVHGLLRYLTVMEHCGTAEPHRWSIHLDPPRAWLTFGPAVSMWFAIVRLALRIRLASDKRVDGLLDSSRSGGASRAPDGARRR